MQTKNRFWTGVRRAYAAYDRLMEKQGFYIVLAICVLVIVLSALYTFYFRELWHTEETEQIPQEYLAAGGTQNAQSLLEAQKLIESQSALSVPTEAPLQFTQPLTGVVIRDFSFQEPQYFASANYWRVHPAVDFEAEYGELVQACADGTVVQTGQNAEKGRYIRIRHEKGYETVYAGLSDSSYVQAGDSVRRGQTIGHVGNGVLAEADAGPHLHLEVWKGETPLDPIAFFLGLTN